MRGRRGTFGWFLFALWLFLGFGQGSAQEEQSVDGFQLAGVLGRGIISKSTLSPDGQTLAVAGSRGIWLYSLPNLELVRHTDTGTWVWQALWSPDGKRLATLDAGGAVYLVGEEGGYTRVGGSSARAVWLWDAASGERLFALEDSATTDGVIWSPTEACWPATPPKA